MSRVIIDNTCLVILSDIELEEYGNEFKYDPGRPMMTFERFCLMKALEDEKILEDRRYSERIYHLEVEREHRVVR